MPFHLTYKWLRFSPPTEPPQPPAEGIERYFVDTPAGALEILHAPAKPTSVSDTPHPSPYFFVHGGMGSAWVWTEYMQYLSARGVPCYAISLRGHGNSWHPSYLRMVFATPRRLLEDDVIAGVKWAQAREGGAQVVLAGHSSGGGLSQSILSKGNLTVKGLALLSAVPGFGSMGVYVNWWKLDPWFTIRMYFHGLHPNSPLSHPALTKAVFFGDKISEEKLLNFHGRMNAYESFMWPFSMMFKFTDSRSIIRNISGWGSAGQRLLVISGGSDKIMTIPIMQSLASWYREATIPMMRSLAGWYREAHGWVVNEKQKIEAENQVPDEVVSLEGEGGLDTAGAGVGFCTVPASGHHFQNDVGWEIGARKMLEFWKQL